MKTLQAVIVSGKLGHSISILLTAYAHYIPNLQGEAAQLMDDILNPITVVLEPIKRQNI